MYWISMGLAIIFPLALVWGSVWAYRHEVQNFNLGKCPRCRVKWRHFDNDSQGGRGYVCDKCDRYTWVSWPGVDTNFQ